MCLEIFELPFSVPIYFNSECIVEYLATKVDLILQDTFAFFRLTALVKIVLLQLIWHIVINFTCEQ